MSQMGRRFFYLTGVIALLMLGFLLGTGYSQDAEKSDKKEAGKKQIVFPVKRLVG